MENNQIKLPFNIQMFADDGGNTNTAVATGTNATVQSQAQTNVNNSNSNVNYDEIFKKLDNILDKRTDGIAKSALKDNGYEDAEMKEILTQYRASKQAKNQEVDNQLSTLQTENGELKATLQKERLNSEALKQASSLNVDEKTVPYLIKLANFNECVDEKGTILPDKVIGALEAVLNDIPSLKHADKGVAGVTVGADTSNETQPSGSLFGFNFTGVRKH